MLTETLDTAIAALVLEHVALAFTDERWVCDNKGMVALVFQSNP